MPIEYYGGEPTITVENAEELYEALDILHTQIMDTCGDDALLSILSDAMERVGRVQGGVVPHIQNIAERASDIASAIGIALIKKRLLAGGTVEIPSLGITLTAADVKEQPDVLD